MTNAILGPLEYEIVPLPDTDEYGLQFRFGSEGNAEYAAVTMRDTFVIRAERDFLANETNARDQRIAELEAQVARLRVVLDRYMSGHVCSDASSSEPICPTLRAARDALKETTP